MPSKNRKHFAAIANGKVIASVSSDSKFYRSATQVDGKRTRWSEEADFYSVEVIETDQRLEVGADAALAAVGEPVGVPLAERAEMLDAIDAAADEAAGAVEVPWNPSEDAGPSVSELQEMMQKAPAIEIVEPDDELPTVEMPTAAEAFGSDGKVHVYGESGELEASFDARDVHVSLPEYGPSATVTAPPLPQVEAKFPSSEGIKTRSYPGVEPLPEGPATPEVAALMEPKTRLVPVGNNGIAIRLPMAAPDVKTHSDTRQPEATPATSERVYKTGQRYTKPGSGIIAKVFLVDGQGRAFARGNRRGLTKILMDESWVLA